MTDKQKLGRKGEKFTVRFLKKNRYKILSRNFSCPYGEIDIVAEKRHFLCFVEVKTRTEGQMLPPSLSVDRKKKQRIIKTANRFMQIYTVERQPRFDIAEVFVNEKGKMRINYIENAFY